MSTRFKIFFNRYINLQPDGLDCRDKVEVGGWSIEAPGAVLKFWHNGRTVHVNWNSVASIVELLDDDVQG